MKKIINIPLILLLIFSILISCNKSQKGKDWDKIASSVEKWTTYDLQIKPHSAVFPIVPVSKTKAFDSLITVFENYAEKDTVTYSVTLIQHKGLKDASALKKFMDEEVLAFKALERKNIKINNRDAVFSKVRENDLCSYSINIAVDDKFIANIAVRYKGDFPSEKLLMAFAERVKF
jgi:hypothetical protein